MLLLHTQPHRTSVGAGDDVVRFWDIRKAGTQVTNTRALSTNVDELQGAPMLAATTRGEWGDPLRQYGVTSITEGHLGVCSVSFGCCDMHVVVVVVLHDGVCLMVLLRTCACTYPP